MRAASAAPSDPARWWRCSLQSTQYLINGRRGGSASKSIPNALELAHAARREAVVEIEAGRRQPIVVCRVGVEDAVPAGQQVVLQHRLHQLGAEHSGEMVVAGASEPDRLRLVPLPERAHLRGRRDPSERFDQLAHLRA